MSELAVKLAGVPLTNPIVAAAGTCGYVDELADAVDLRRVGAVVTKSITARPRSGNPTPRIIDMPCGMLNAIGLANVGVERFVAEKLPRADGAGTVVIGSIAGGSVEDYVTVAEAFDAAPALPIVELNVSCPNTDDGLEFGEDAGRLRELVTAARRALTRTKLFVKLSPNVGDVAPLARVAIDAGADGLTLINTVSGMSIDVVSRRTRLSTGGGGYSGPGIHPIAVRIVHDVHQRVAREAGVPIIGVGGVMNWRDAAELILAGATAVGAGTALFADPRAPKRLARGLARWVRDQGAGDIGELVGGVRMP